jgi:hypothetical protein
MTKDEIPEDKEINDEDLVFEESDGTDNDVASEEVAPEEPDEPEEAAEGGESKDDVIKDETIEELDSEAEENESKQKEGLQTKTGSTNKLADLLKTPKRKVMAAIIAIIVVTGAVYAIPASRYGVLGIFIKKNITIVVNDTTTKKPVSQAKVTINGQTVNTASDGTAKFSQVPTGEYTVVVSKKYYKDSNNNFTVPSFGEAQADTISLSATGRQIELSVVNKITRQPLAKALIKLGETSGETDDKGLATIVLPADKKTVTGTIAVDGYNSADITVTVSENSDANKFSVTPVGRIAYLSKITGKINLMTANLDGSDSKVMIQGTGNEKDNTTSQLAARDWNYVALQAHRASDSRNQLYVVDTKSGNLKTVDSGDVDLQLIGWSGHKFVYIVNRSYSYNTDKRQALKSYDADTGKLSTIDETHLIGGLSENLGDLYIVNSKIVYVKSWWDNTSTKGSIFVMNPDGSGKKSAHDIDLGAGTSGYLYLNSKLYEPAAIYYDINDKVFEYENGAVKQAAISVDDLENDFYPTFLLSPSDKKTFWYEPRDGKNTIFVGDDQAKSPKTLATLSDFATYGWYGDDYVLLSKNGSELYVAPADETFDKVAPLKVTDYHKPTLTYPGYGSGYGGL